jgi:hypothetical protein
MFYYILQKLLIIAILLSTAEAGEKSSRALELLKISGLRKEEKFISNILKLNNWSALGEGEFRVWIIKFEDTSNYVLKGNFKSKDIQVCNGDWIKKYKMVSEIKQTSDFLAHLTSSPILFGDHDESYISSSLKSAFIIEYYNGLNYKWAIRQLRKTEIQDYNRLLLWSGKNIPNLNIGWAIPQFP